VKNKNYIVLFYVVVSVVWLVISDQLISVLIQGIPAKDQAMIHSLKGVLFITLSALLLHYLVSLYHKGQTKTRQYLEQSLENSRKEQQQWYYAQKMAKVAAWEYFLKTDEVVWSDNLYTLFGLEPDAPITPAAFFMEQVHPDDIDGLNSNMDAVIATGELDYTHRLKVQGEWRQVRHAGKVIYQNGEAFKISGIIQDITESYTREQLLNRTLEWYELVNKATHDAIWDWDLNTDQLIWNSGLLPLFGYDPKSIPKTMEWWEDKVHPDERKMVVASLDEFVLKVKKRWEASYRFLCADGTYKYVFDQAYLLKGEDGMPRRVIGAVKDIDEYKRKNEENLRLSEVVSKVKNGVVIKDCEERIQWVNPAFENLTGYKLVELKGKLADEILHGADTSSVTRDYIANSLREQNFFHAEIVNYHKSGQPYWVEINSTPIFDSQALHSGYIDIVTEVTERKNRETRINEQNKVLKEIAWINSHEIRKPVSSILGLYTLIQSTEDADEKQQYYAMIDDCVRELDEIVHLTAAKVNTLMRTEKK
jgi:PAS domain S-box-containing protein